MTTPSVANRFAPTPRFAGLNPLGAQAAGPFAQPTQNTFGLAYAIGAAYLFFLFSHASEFIDTTGRLHMVVILAFAAAIAAFTSGKIQGLRSVFLPGF